jgi:hypothetical protein
MFFLGVLFAIPRRRAGGDRAAARTFPPRRAASRIGAPRRGWPRSAPPGAIRKSLLPKTLQ